MEQEQFFLIATFNLTQFECGDTLPRTFGLDPVEGILQYIEGVYVDNL